MSLRQIAKELGVSQSFLSQIRTGKRPMPDSLRAKVDALDAYHLLITDKQQATTLAQGVGWGADTNPKDLNGGGEGDRTPGPLLAKPTSKAGVFTTTSLLEAFISDKKATKGLTASGEEWLRDTLGRFLEWLPVPVSTVTRLHVVLFLGRYEAMPWRKHSMYRALRTFWKWVSTTYDAPNPMIDRWGNPAVEAPKTPNKVLYTQTPDKVKRLIEAAAYARDKAIISLLADSGARLSEVTSINMAGVDLAHNRIKVLGKGNKEGYLVFGAKTRALVADYIREAQPTGNLFGLTSEGLKTMLQRLEQRTGIKANAHSFRRGFATALRRQGVGDLDIMQLGRWSSVGMVQRYTKAYTFDDAAARYKPIVT